MKHRLERKQLIKCEVEIAWNFFSSPHNLARITPESMRFNVLSMNLEDHIYDGMRIEYKVSPFRGISIFWRTRIEGVKKNYQFIDYQEKGPYKFWRHLHEFEITAEGVIIKDTVDYQLPYGVLGELVHKLVVKRKLKKIFDYRFETLEKMFNRK